MILKKKIGRLEQTDNDLKDLVSNFGSLDNLLRDNERLMKENEKYKWMERRFNHHFLLRRDHLLNDDIAYLKALIFALQNEL